MSTLIVVLSRSLCLVSSSDGRLSRWSLWRHDWWLLMWLGIAVARGPSRVHRMLLIWALWEIWLPIVITALHTLTWGWVIRLSILSVGRVGLVVSLMRSRGHHGRCSATRAWVTVRLRRATIHALVNWILRVVLHGHHLLLHIRTRSLRNHHLWLHVRTWSTTWAT